MNKRKHDAFVRLAEARTSKLLDKLRILGNLSNRNNYSYTEDEINAIISYVELGHGFVTSSNSIVYSPDELAPFLGVVESLTYSGSSVESMEIVDPSHPVMDNVVSLFPWHVKHDLSINNGEAYW